MASGARTVFAVSVAVALACGCVSSPTIDDERPPPVGAVQPPAAGGASLSAAAACAELVKAEKGARSKLGCDESAVDLSCPGHLRLAGATPCDAYDKGSVDACVSAIEGYSACTDFTAKPCIVTLDRASCRAPTLSPDAGRDGGRADSSVPVPDAAGPDAGVVKDAAPGADASAPDAGGAVDAAAPGDAGVPVDAATG